VRAVNRPLCFVLMPFGRKADAAARVIDFDRVYRDLIAPAITAADMDPLRADEEMTGGIIHKPMFERLILCEYGLADLTAANANVFYELGVRHAVRPASTLLVFAEGTGQLPFDVGLLRGLPYALGADGRPSETARDRANIVARLEQARLEQADSPIFQLVEGFPDIQRLKTDVFREQVRYRDEIKTQLASARKTDLDAVRAVERSLGAVNDQEAGVVVDLFLSYRDVKAWDDMIALVPRMSAPLARSVLVQEQLGLALNRAGRSDDAERVLLAVIDKHGPSSETYSLLGRVYKDRWDAAVKTGHPVLARGLLKQAIQAYLQGFQADWRDAYPGINAVTLMELADPPDPRRQSLVQVVAYAVERRIATGRPDYWDHATRLEVAVLAHDEAGAESALADALACQPEGWKRETTARNLRLIRDARERRGEEVRWAGAIEQELER
jgi:hypothetical protein